MNAALLVFIFSGYRANGSPWKTAEETAAALQAAEDGYVLSETADVQLRSQGAWAILIDNDSLKVVWHSDNLPDVVPMEYTVSDIADFTRGYIHC